MPRRGKANGLPIVYAYQDGGVLVEGTRWEPRRVSCTRSARHSDRPGRLFVAKYRRGDRQSAAALIGEVVSLGILRALGIRTFEAAIVRASPSMSRHYARDPSISYAVPAGDHFGTLYRSDVVPAQMVDGSLSFREKLADARELIAIWAADSWLMNLDREVYGNLLLEPGAHRTWHLLAADQSDCFLGAGALADGSCFERSREHGAAAYLPQLEPTLLQLGSEPLGEIAARIENVAAQVHDAVAPVPEEWWLEANVSLEAVVHCLVERAEKIREILQIEHWEGMSDAVQGGFLLGG